MCKIYVYYHSRDRVNILISYIIYITHLKLCVVHTIGILIIFDAIQICNNYESVAITNCCGEWTANMIRRPRVHYSVLTCFRI